MFLSQCLDSRCIVQCMFNCSSKQTLRFVQIIWMYNLHVARPDSRFSPSHLPLERHFWKRSRVMIVL